MDILVLGGTVFVGRTIVDRALADGHGVTLFGRGRTGAELFPGVERRIGDRSAGDYRSLEGASWDAVVDVSAYVPRHVAQVADVLDGRVGRYLLISTGSVYDWAAAVERADESAPRLRPERSTEEITDTTYGPLKVACEDDALDRFGERATVVRPGIVAGPHDPTDRFTWWVRKVAAGRVAVPARTDQPVQVVDSRDLADLVVALVTDDRGGVFNAVGPADPTTIAGMVDACARAAGSTPETVTVPPAGADLPLVLGPGDPDVIFERSAAAARSVGLTATPLEGTAADVLAWDRDRGRPPLTAGPSPEREAELLTDPTFRNS
ncbi:MAG: NAD-dependent epimerase/dehydratase family protein [Acidimicrobiales bacterium]